MSDFPEKERLLILRLSEIVLSNLGNEHFGVNELVAMSGLTHYQLIHRLQSATGKTISQFIRDIRLEKALDMIKSQDLTVSQIAYMTGFCSPTYFNTCFAEYFGYSPGSAKKANSDNTGNLKNPNKHQETIKTKSSIRIVSLAAITGAIVLFIIVLDDFFLFNRSLFGSVLYNDNNEKSIGIIPFRNLSGAETDSYFTAGITDEIYQRLSIVPEFRIISSISMEQFRDNNEPASEIAKKLKVNYILTGSCQKDNNAYRLRVQLVNALQDKQIWADTYDKDINRTIDLTGVQSEIAQSVAEALRAKITPATKKQIEKTPTLSLDAYDYYLRGREEDSKLGRYEFNNEIIKHAEEYYYFSLSYDSSYSQAYIGLAQLLWKRWYLDYNPSSHFNADNCLDSMFLLANIGLKYDPANEEGYLIRGSYYSVKGTPVQALNEFNKAIKYNPNLGLAYFMKGGLLEELDITASIENFIKASKLCHGSELVTTLTRIAYMFYNAGFPEIGEKYLKEADILECDSALFNYKKSKILAETTGDFLIAAKIIRNRLSATPENTILYRDMGYCYCMASRYKEAMESYNEYISRFRPEKRSSPFLNRFTCLGFVFQQMNLPDKSELYFRMQTDAYTKRLKSILPSERIYWAYPLAGVYASMGNKQKALECLEMFSQNPSYTLTWVTMINKDPQFNNLRGNPKFEKIRSGIEEKYLAEHRKVGKWLEDMNY